MTWYKTGTIAVSGATVTGTGTNWTDNKLGIGSGQALLIPGAGSVKMYEILRVDSSTKITLASDAGSIAAGSAYAIMSFYTDSVPDFARRLAAQLSYYQSQMDGWQQIMTSPGTINIESPDGTIVAISSFKKLTDDMAGKADKISGAVPIAQGGTAATTAAAARSNLGLGSAATLGTGISAGNVITIGGVTGTPAPGYRFYQIDSALSSAISLNAARVAGVYPNLVDYSTSTAGPTSSGYGYVQNYVRIPGDAGASTQFSLPYATQADAGRYFYRGFNTNAWSPWKEILTSAVSDGTAKNVGEPLDPEIALLNISRMEFKNFTFKNDEDETPRRGVISQQIETIDPEYVKKIGELLHLDQTPMLLDGLAAVQALLARIERLDSRIKELERDIPANH